MSFESRVRVVMVEEADVIHGVNVLLDWDEQVVSARVLDGTMWIYVARNPKVILDD